ncbi:MAG: hypothetical protein VKI42_00895 [Synechococcaceae cyanobacterium]|nr:hypothetical protein [Synechococcaceae cyanobacterium]
MDESFTIEELYIAACQVAREKNRLAGETSIEKSRATQISYVLTDTTGRTLARIPIEEVISRAKLIRPHAIQADPIDISDQQIKEEIAHRAAPTKEGFLERHDRERYEHAVFHAQLNQLLQTGTEPCQEQSGSAPGLSNDYILRDKNGEFLLRIDSWSVTRSGIIKEEKQKMREAIANSPPEQVAQKLQRSSGGRLEFNGGFYTGKALATEWHTIILITPPFEEIDMNDIAEVRLLDSRNEKDFLGAAGASVLAGATLGLLTGGLGLIGAGAGLLAGGNNSESLFLFTLKDGRESIATCQSKVYAKLLSYSLLKT